MTYFTTCSKSRFAPKYVKGLDSVQSCRPSGSKKINSEKKPRANVQNSFEINLASSINEMDSENIKFKLLNNSFNTCNDFLYSNKLNISSMVFKEVLVH